MPTVTLTADQIMFVANAPVPNGAVRMRQVVQIGTPNNTDQSLAVTKPSDLEDGDLWIVITGTATGGSAATNWTPPAGWTELVSSEWSTDIHGTAWAKTAYQEPASYTWTWDQPVYGAAVGFGVQWLGLTPDVQGQTTDHTTTAHTTPTLTTTVDDLIISFWVSTAQTGMVPDGGTQIAQEIAGVTNIVQIDVTTDRQITPGSTTPHTATSSSARYSVNGVMAFPVLSASAAISARAAVTATKAGGSGTSIAKTIPGTWKAGDLLVATVLQNSNASTITGPVGWVEVGVMTQAGASANTQVSMWAHIASAADIGATKTWNSTSTAAMGVILEAYVVVADHAAWDGNLPIAEATAGSTGGTTHTTASVTTDVNNELVVAAASVGVAGGGTFTPPASMNERGDVTSGAGAVTLADAIQAIPGASGAKIFTFSSTIDSAASVIAVFSTRPDINVSGVIAASGSDLSAVAASQAQGAAIPATGVSAVAVAGYETQFAADAPRGTSTVHVAGVRGRNGALSALGVGAVHALPVRAAVGTVAVTGSGNAHVSGVRRLSGALALVGHAATTVGGSGRTVELASPFGADWASGSGETDAIWRAANETGGTVTTGTRTLYLRQHDLVPVAEAILTDGNGPVNLSTATTVMFRMGIRGSGTFKVESAATIVDGPSGLVRYNWTAPDVTEGGTFNVSWLVTFSDGRPGSFPNKGFTTVIIEEEFP